MLYPSQRNRGHCQSGRMHCSSGRTCESVPQPRATRRKTMCLQSWRCSDDGSPFESGPRMLAMGYGAAAQGGMYHSRDAAGSAGSGSGSWQAQQKWLGWGYQIDLGKRRSSAMGMCQLGLEGDLPDRIGVPLMKAVGVLVGTLRDSMVLSSSKLGPVMLMESDPRFWPMVGDR